MGLIFSSEEGKRTIFFRSTIFIGWFLVSVLVIQIITPGLLGMIGGAKLFFTENVITLQKAFRAGYESRMWLMANHGDLIFYLQLSLAFGIITFLALIDRLPYTSKYE